jgi:flagellar motor component MotA
MINFKGTNRQLLNLYRGLENVKDIRGSRFAVLVGKNMKEIKHVLQPIEEAAVPTPSFQTVSIQMRDLMEAEDKEGMEQLENENKELIEERKDQMKRVEDMLETATELTLHGIREDQLPDDITGEQVEKILEIITDGND